MALAGTGMFYTKQRLFNLAEATCIGQGSFGAVYRCEYQGHAYAVKRILIAHASRGEIECLHRLRHAQSGSHVEDLDFVANLFMCYMDDENVYLVTELVCSPPLQQECTAEGGQPSEVRCSHLGDLIERYSRSGRRCPPEKAFMVMWQCLRGLAAVHRRGCSHGDVKPNNIVLEEHCREKRVEVLRCALIDFGCGTVFPVNCPPPAASTGAAYYRDPAASRADVTQSDVWSLGLTFLCLYLGRHPCFGVAEDATSEMLQRYEYFEELVLCAARAGPTGSIDTEILLLLSRMVRCDPAQRASATELLALASEVAESERCHPFIVDEVTMVAM